MIEIVLIPDNSRSCLLQHNFLDQNFKRVSTQSIQHRYFAFSLFHTKVKTKFKFPAVRHTTNLILKAFGEFTKNRLERLKHI